VKNKILFIFTLIFALNTLSLSALATPCPHLQTQIEQAAAANMPDCHKKPESPSTKGHCKGICFCLHAQLNNSALPPDMQMIQLSATKQTSIPLREQFVFALSIAPPLKPPTILS
jgi:hypothetical protein